MRNHFYQNFLILFCFMIPCTIVPVFAASPSDVKEDHWAKPSIEFLLNHGVIKLGPNGSFSGEKFLNRYEMAVLLARLMNQKETKVENSISKSDMDTIKVFLKDLSNEMLELKNSMKEIREKIGLPEQNKQARLLEKKEMHQSIVSQKFAKK
ncbi:MAG: S-layer homology domain-containing protein [Candidatus Riflebacteria bacterium]|nr:S-layer homology domain-containing protein [Candidatus Riflebacteria bacterium]